MNKHLFAAREMVRVAKALIAYSYGYIYDPEHRNRPEGGGWEKTDKGWSRGKEEKEAAQSSSGSSTKSSPAPEEVILNGEPARKKIEAGLKVVSEGKARFEGAHKTVLNTIGSLEKAKKEIDAQQKALEDVLKSDFAAFDKENHITEHAKAVSNTLADMMAMGENVQETLDSLGDAEKVLVNAKVSEKPSYKGAYEMLKSMLNGTEFQKYVDIVEGSFKKNIVEVERASHLTKTATNTFDSGYKKEFEKHAEEFAKRHPDAPRLKLQASARLLRAGTLIDAIGGWTRGVFSAAVSAMMEAAANLEAMENDIKAVNDYCDRLRKAAKEVVANA